MSFERLDARFHRPTAQKADSGLGHLPPSRRPDPERTLRRQQRHGRVRSAKAIPTKYCRSIPTTPCSGGRCRGPCVRIGGIAGLFRDRLQGSPRPQGYVRRSADPFLRRCRGKYRLLHLFLHQGRRNQDFPGALQLHLSQARRQLAHCGASFVRDATRPEIALGLAPLG